MMILRLTYPPWKRSPSIIDSLIPSLPVGFLRLVQTSLQMTLPRRVIWRVIRITGLWACVVFSWTGRFLIFNSISQVQVQEIDYDKACWRDLLNSSDVLLENLKMLWRTSDWAHSGLFEVKWSEVKLNLIILCFAYHTLNLYCNENFNTWVFLLNYNAICAIMGIFHWITL